VLFDAGRGTRNSASSCSYLVPLRLSWQWSRLGERRCSDAALTYSDRAAVAGPAVLAMEATQLKASVKSVACVPER